MHCKKIAIPVGKIPEKALYRSVFLLIRHSKYGAMLLKIHSYRLLFRINKPEFYFIKLRNCPNVMILRETNDLKL